MKAVCVFADRYDLDADCFAEIVLWWLPDPVPGSRHPFKYRLYYGCAGLRLVGYDNERGKGDHRHIDGKEYAYTFIDEETLMADFWADVDAMRRRG
jgi:Family of unknown function (DUF6516)